MDDPQPCLSSPLSRQISSREIGFLTDAPLTAQSRGASKHGATPGAKHWGNAFSVTAFPIMRIEYAIFGFTEQE